MVLTVFFTSRISPRTSTVILRERSPLATAVVTSAMLRTCVVRFAAMEFTLSVRSFHVPATPRHIGLAAQFAFRTYLARHARDFGGERAELIHHGVDGVLQLQNFAARIHRDLSGQIALGYGGGHSGDVTHLIGQVAGHGVDRIGQILPGSGHAAHVRLAAQFALGAHLARHASHFTGERVELIHHGVDGVLQLQNFAAHVHCDLAREVALGHGRGDFRDVAHLVVRLPAMELTESVRSFQVPATPFTSAWPPSLPSVPTSRATRVTSPANALS